MFATRQSFLLSFSFGEHSYLIMYNSTKCYNTILLFCYDWSAIWHFSCSCFDMDVHLCVWAEFCRIGKMYFQIKSIVNRLTYHNSAVNWNTTGHFLSAVDELSHESWLNKRQVEGGQGNLGGFYYFRNELFSIRFAWLQRWGWNSTAKYHLELRID